LLDPAQVLLDVQPGWETPVRASEVYGVALVGSVEDKTLAVDIAITSELRMVRHGPDSDKSAQRLQYLWLGKMPACSLVKLGQIPIYKQ